MSGYRRYADLTVGDVFEDVSGAFTVSDRVVDAFLAATQDTLPRFQPRGDGAPRPAPAMLAGAYTRGALNALKGPPGGVHAKQRFRFERPVFVGDALRTTLRVAEKYEKKGRRYLVSELTTLNQHGEVVTTGGVVSIWGQE